MQIRSINTVLVANRGEIAARIIRTIKAKGMRAVAIFSVEDRGAPHTELADEAVCIGGHSAQSSYLNIEAVLHAAALCNADAIHPGYGFLSENSMFAEACIRQGITFVGPNADIIALMADKRQAKTFASEVGVACVPGFMGDTHDVDTLLSEAKKIGFPILIKAVAGGGGRGMRRVNTQGELADALTAARSEALRGFGNNDIILEKYIEEGRHVEVQVMADEYGHAIHLGDRDCSMQRRYQKVIEEAPAPDIDDSVRAAMHGAAVTLTRECGYKGAGTVEFLLSPNGEFYFLEMNTRLQVEHPVTECITGVDIVAMQLDIAAGKPVPQQSSIKFSGHAIECRWYAEDPGKEFTPQAGDVTVWLPAYSHGVRIDSALIESNPSNVVQRVSQHYDPLLAKVITHGHDRDEAIALAQRVVKNSVLLGVVTNQQYLLSLLNLPIFKAARMNVQTLATIEHEHASLTDENWAVIIAGYFISGAGEQYAAFADAGWFGWSNLHTLRHKLSLVCHGQQRETLWGTDEKGLYVSFVESDEAPHIASEKIRIKVLEKNQHEITLEIDDRIIRCYASRHGDVMHLKSAEHCWHVRRVITESRTNDDAPLEQSDTLNAPMTGIVVEVCVRQGDKVKTGQVLARLEAMKMQYDIKAPDNAVVSSTPVNSGDQVSAGDVMIRLTHPDTSTHSENKEQVSEN